MTHESLAAWASVLLLALFALFMLYCPCATCRGMRRTFREHSAYRRRLLEADRELAAEAGKGRPRRARRTSLPPGARAR